MGRRQHAPQGDRPRPQGEQGSPGAWELAVLLQPLWGKSTLPYGSVTAWLVECGPWGQGTVSAKPRPHSCQNSG